MKKLILPILFLFLTQFTFAQSNLLEATIQKIEIKEDTIKSVFDWVTDNIRYDVKKLKEIEANNKSKSKKKSKFQTDEEYEQSLLKKVIKHNKGVCEDYSLLFHSIVDKLGYESYVVEEYTKDSQGKVQRGFGHAWNAIKVNGSWKLYDPTRGAGYVEEGKRFVKHFNPEWYEVAPEELLKTHMPFDPLWQLAEKQMTYKEFNNSTTAKGVVESMDYAKAITIFLNEGAKEQMQAQVNRSKELGKGMRLVEQWRKRITKRMNLYGITSQQDLLEETYKKANKSVDLLNDFIKAKNKQFKGKRHNITTATSNLTTAQEQLNIVLDIYNSIEVEDKKAVNAINKAIRQSEKLLRQVDKEFAYLEKNGLLK